LRSPGILKTMNTWSVAVATAVHQKDDHHIVPAL
jgi:hypothetical protein